MCYYHGCHVYTKKIYFTDFFISYTHRALVSHTIPTECSSTNLGISAATKKAYTAGLRKYITFCSDASLQASITHEPRERLPITFPIMVRLHVVFSKHTSNYRDVMIWAACYLAYFGLLRVIEFTTSSPDHFDPSTDLLLSDVALDNKASPTLVQITLKQLKGDQFRKGTQICLGKMTHAIRSLVQYLVRQGGTPGPLFVWPNNKALTRASFSSALNKALKELHMDPHQFNAYRSELVLLHQPNGPVWVTHTWKPWEGGEVMPTYTMFDCHHKI